MPQKAFVLLVRYLSADQSFDPAAFRRVTYAQRKQLPFLYPLFPARPASIKALVRTTAIWGLCKRLTRTVLIFTESSDQLSRATDRVPGLPASPGYVQ
ncbi:hypothetical protein F0C88_24005 [Escherichia coli]|nr:hypothetical protein [Escherichia coli]